MVIIGRFTNELYRGIQMTEKIQKLPKFGNTIVAVR